MFMQSNILRLDVLLLILHQFHVGIIQHVNYKCCDFALCDLSLLHHSCSAEARLSWLKMYSFMGGGLFCAIVGNILLVVSTVTDYWMQYRLSGNYAHQGLWRYCMSNKCYMQTDSIGKTLGMSRFSVFKLSCLMSRQYLNSKHLELF